jgi:hypothetical protein
LKKELYNVGGQRRLRKDMVAMRRPAPDPLPQPTIEEQRPPKLVHTTRLWCAFLEALKQNHHPRPEKLYARLILQCSHEGRTDEAAKVYVGLVEDWIMEGRVAEGAHPDDFGHSGLPARDRETLESSKSLFDMWFGTVRTWRLPGEALSLHDRLALWHPQHAAPDKCLRGFPLPNPTSPPSQVPPPTVELLLVILKSLQLDPHTATPVEYATSMRALAIMANTILSRSLPIPAIPRLLNAFSNSHIHPAVYPESYTAPPERDAWAYTANTQVHVALVTLMFSPPNYARAAEIQQQSIDKYLPTPEGAARYSLHPLGWQSCMVLIKYATHQMRQPRLLNRLIEYMKATFVGWTPTVFTQLFRGASRTRDNQLAESVESALFKQSPLSADGVESTSEVLGLKYVARPPRPAQALTSGPSKSASAGPMVQTDHEDILSLPFGTADSESVAALISHLAATSQFDRLRKTVHILIPFLSINLETPPEDIQRISELTGTEIGHRGRLRPSELTPQLYAVIINALAKGGHTGLAQRVFFLAEQTERRYIERIIKLETEAAAARGDGGDSDLPTISVRALAPVRLPIHVYTSMMYVYGSERKKNHSPRRGWNVPKRYELLSRSEAGRQMARRLHRHVSLRYKQLRPAERALTPHLLPDERYFNAVIRALNVNWHLDSSEPLERQHAKKVNEIIEDMAALGIVPPHGLLQKLTPPYRVSSSPYLHVGRAAPRNVPKELRETRISASRAVGRFLDYDRQELQDEWTERDEFDVVVLDEADNKGVFAR